MNTQLSLGSGDLWQVAGWTMLHFLWLGALAGLAAGACRLVLRRAAAHVRYAAALVCLAVLAALPVGTAAWVGAKLQVADRPGQAMRIAFIESAARPQTVAGHGDGGDAPVIDLAVNKLPVAVSNVTDTVPMVATNFAPDSNGPLPLVVFAIESAASYLPWLWLLGAPLTFLLLATGVVGAERLRRTSRVIEDGPIVEACARLIESLRIGRRVTVAVCERIVAPVLVGIVRPIILLPPAALTGWSPDEIEMVLLHELAHVRRWDNLVNLAQRLVESLLFFHPAVWLVSNWVRREREACCDAIVVGRTSQPHAYAEMLVALAACVSEPSETGRPRPRSSAFSRGRGRPGSLVSSAMAAGPLRSRICRILNLEDDPMLISSKSLGVVMSGLLLAATLIVLNLPERTTAEESVQREDGKIATKAVDQELARQVEVTNQLKYLGLALHWYHDTKGSFPANASYDTFDRPLLSWRVHILPYLDGNAAEDGAAAALYKEFHLDEPWDSEHNRTLIARMPAVFQNPNRPAGPFTSYLAAVGSDCVFDGTPKGTSFAEIPDGMSNTIMLVEADDAVEWTRPADLKFNPATPKIGLGDFRPNGWIAVFADGSVRKIGKDEPADNVRDWFTRGRQDTFVATQPAAPNERAPFPSPEDQTFAEVPFVLGATRFADGDKITITEVRGTAETIKPGNIYWIRGSYKLGSRDRAKLAANTTVKDAAHGTSASLSVQSTNVDRGEGTFTLFLPMSYLGWPHVSFYPADGGQSFGGIYFGTGESVLKESWGAKEAIDATAKDVAEYTDSQQSVEDVRRVTIAISDDQTATAESQPGRLRLQIRKMESKSGTFPSLEDQKLADLAWKGMGIELEKIGQSDSQRIKALGYDGGVKVVSTTDRVIGQPLQSDDILIGLHVWPTTSLKDVAEVLNRDDLAELNPLKFYVLRDVGGGLGPARDAVVTGRISANLIDRSEWHAANDRYSSASTRNDTLATRSAAAASPYSAFPAAPLIRRAIPGESRPPITDENGNATVVTQPYHMVLQPKQVTSVPAATTPPAPVTPAADLFSVPKPVATKASQRNRLMFFYAPGSRPSDEMQSTLDWIGQQYPIEITRVDAIAQPALAQSLEIKSVPAVVFFRNDEEVGRIVGVTRKSQVMDAIASLTSGDVPGSASNKPTLRYDGKTFHEWQTAWKTELSTEKRLEVVKALAAFGANGFGKEAAELILDIAIQYEWRPTGPAYVPEGALQQAIVAALGGGSPESAAIPVRYWLPVLLDRLRSNSSDGRLYMLSRIVLFQQRFHRSTDVDIEPLLESARDKTSPLHQIALLALAAVDPHHKDARVTAIWQEILNGHDDDEIVLALESLSSALPTVPETDLQSLLLNSDPRVQYQARRALNGLAENQPGKTKELIPSLRNVIQDQQRVDDHLAAIRGLATLGKPALDGYAELEKIMLDREQPMATRVAAMKALERITLDGSIENRLRDDFISANKDRRKTPEYRMEWRQFDQAIQAESQALP